MWVSITYNPCDNDGSESSVYAIKQFVNLFPWTMFSKTILALHVWWEMQHSGSAFGLKEFAASHFENFSSSVNKIPVTDKNILMNGLQQLSNSLYWLAGHSADLKFHYSNAVL